ncbi:hypothetical protein L5515_010325 [Caenorhabditis briggsae]|uniref:DUF38 domain-containing protein n=1 Tax=Caenorhabditis briggsae TaxID=6238 RepID=A0AAE9JEX3_CAEBR|nr:hypothetical protein L5515_010325 [Caenorhabditis briggsae]
MKIIMDYGKIKVQMKNWNIIDVIHVDYWRCDQETTLVWHGYFARFDSSRKFQQLAAYNNPKLDPFYKFYKQLSHRLRHQIKDATEDQVMDILKYVKPRILRKITIRKWDDSHMHRNGKTRVMKSWRMVPQLKQWEEARYFDIRSSDFQNF